MGHIVRLQDGTCGIIRFAGQPHFAPGDWVGVELETSTGKNDGSVQGERYFDCKMGHGMFLRPRAVTVIGVAGDNDDDDNDAADDADESAAPSPPRQPPPRTAVASARPLAGATSAGNATYRTTAGGRPSSVYTSASAGSRASISGDPSLTKRMSLNAPSPSPGPRSRPSSIVRVSAKRSSIFERGGGEWKKNLSKSGADHYLVAYQIAYKTNRKWLIEHGAISYGNTI